MGSNDRNAPPKLLFAHIVICHQRIDLWLSLLLLLLLSFRRSQDYDRHFCSTVFETRCCHQTEFSVFT